MAVWTAEANWPVAWTFICFSPITLEGGEFIVYVTGFEGTGVIKKFYKYNIDTNTWTELAVPPNYSSSPALAMSPDGSQLAYNISSLAFLYIYDIGGNSWTTSAAAPQISGVNVSVQSAVWADDDTIWVTVRVLIAATWRVKCFKYVVSTDTWTQYTNSLTPTVNTAYAMGISPDGTTLYIGSCGSIGYKASKYVIATDTYTQNALTLASSDDFTYCNDRNRLWYGAHPAGLWLIRNYIDLSDESVHTAFPENASRTKPSNITAGIYNGVSAIVHYCVNEPKNWSYILPLSTVTTDPATALLATEATLNGTLDDDGGEACDCGFEWGETVAYGNTTPTQSKTAGQTFAQTITGLDPVKTYHFRAFATNTAGTSYGSDETFTPSVAPAVVITDPASAVGQTTATPNGTLNDDGGEACDCGFEYGETTDYGTETPTQSKTTSETFSQEILGLKGGTVYHFRAKAINSVGTSYGADRTFHTEALSAEAHQALGKGYALGRAGL